MYGLYHEAQSNKLVNPLHRSPLGTADSAKELVKAIIRRVE